MNKKKLKSTLHASKHEFMHVLHACRRAGWDQNDLKASVSCKSIVKVHFANETVLRKRHAVYCSSIMNAFMILEHFNLHHTTPIIFQTVFLGFLR